MRVPVRDAAAQLEARGLLVRCRHDYSERIIEHVRQLLGRDLPTDLIDFYRERISRIGEFAAQVPTWNSHVGWRSPDALVTKLLPADAVPVFDDGCGSLYGLDLMPNVEVPAVYFFDHDDGFETPQFAAGSSLGAFLFLLAEKDRAAIEDWPERWQSKIDPDITACPRAPAIWLAG